MHCSFHFYAPISHIPIITHKRVHSHSHGQDHIPPTCVHSHNLAIALVRTLRQGSSHIHHTLALAAKPVKFTHKGFAFSAPVISVPSWHCSTLHVAVLGLKTKAVRKPSMALRVHAWFQKGAAVSNEGAPRALGPCERGCRKGTCQWMYCGTARGWAGCRAGCPTRMTPPRGKGQPARRRRCGETVTMLGTPPNDPSSTLGDASCNANEHNEIVRWWQNYNEWMNNANVRYAAQEKQRRGVGSMATRNIMKLYKRTSQHQG